MLVDLVRVAGGPADEPFRFASMRLRMDLARFWEIINSSRERAGAIERQAGTDFFEVHIATFADVLTELSPDDLVAFERHFTDCLNAAYRWDIWAAAHWLHGGCSDDAFWDFRSCLISTGKENFHRVLANPDDLAEIEDQPNIPYLQCEGLQYVAMKAYKDQTGKEMPHDHREVLQDPGGDDFDFEDAAEMARRYPKLVTKYPNMG